jgi:Zn finger protein HypA/HybF involved in hydrogenase expression
MSNNKLLDSHPSVTITKNKNELKVYQGNQIYLNHGDNFELKFFNPLNYKIGIEILFNGIRKGDNYLVLNPGQDITLDRFLDEQRKMLFETYTVDGNNKAAVKAIEQNGLITFNFYKEYHNTNNVNDVKVNYNFPPEPYNYSKGNVRSKGSNGTKGFNGTNGTGGSQQFGSLNTNSRIYSSTPGVYTQDFSSDIGSGTLSLSNITSTSTNVSNLSSANSTFTSSLPFQQDYIFPSSAGPAQKIDTIETGRVEKGELSSQNLRQVNAQFQSEAFHSVSYKLLPYSAKSVEITEVRHYCTSCGYRLRKESWKFCPRCGDKI